MNCSWTIWRRSIANNFVVSWSVIWARATSRTTQPPDVSIFNACKTGKNSSRYIENYINGNEGIQPMHQSEDVKQLKEAREDGYFGQNHSRGKYGQQNTQNWVEE
jgi:hypothetical protein